MASWLLYVKRGRRPPFAPGEAGRSAALVIMGNISAKVTIVFTMDDIITDDDLQRNYAGSLLNCVKDILCKDGVCAHIGDDMRVIQIEWKGVAA